MSTSQMISRLQRLQVLVKDLKLHDEAGLLKKAEARLSEDNFKILVAGEFGRGKSEFINALLEEELLATSVLRLPVINKIVFGEKRVARTGNDGHLQEVDIQELKEGEYLNAELALDSDLLNGIEILEYPSMAEAPDEEVFREAVSEADLVIVVVSCDSIYSKSEKDIVETIIRRAGHRVPYFVATHYDRVRAKDEEEVKRSALTRLPVNEDHLFYVSSVKALEGDQKAKDVFHKVRSAIKKEYGDRASLKNNRVAWLINDITERALEQVERTGK